MKSLREPGRIQERLIDAHRIHVFEPRLRMRRAFDCRMPNAGIQFADLVPRHSRPPNRVPRNVRVHRVAKDLAVDLEIRTELAFLAPQGVLAQRTKLRVQVFAPYLMPLRYMGVT